MARILLAEDNPVTAEIMSVRLEHAGHEVFCAADGRQALEQLNRSRPHLILLDMMMPEVDGMEFLRTVKRDAILGSIPVLVVSARSHEDDILTALAAGADDYVTKPFSLRELLARVDRVLAQGPEPLRIAVQGRHGHVTVGEIVSADPQSASVRFHRDSAPRFAIGDRAKLSLSSPSLPRNIELDAAVFARTEAEPHRTYTFRIEREGRLAREMGSAFLNLIGSRGDYRVRLEEDETVEVHVLTQSDGDSPVLLGTLQDISTSGARVLLKGDAERQLHLVDSFELRLRLPGEETPLKLAVEIRHRVASGDAVAYGIRFDAHRSPDFLEQQAQISEFVLSRTVLEED